jgi:hypothetical protein
VVSSPFKFANPSSNEFEFLWEARWWCEEDKRACNPACIFSIARARALRTHTNTNAAPRSFERERERENLPLLFVFRVCFVVQKLEILKRR